MLNARTKYALIVSLLIFCRSIIAMPTSSLGQADLVSTLDARTIDPKFLFDIYKGLATEITSLHYQTTQEFVICRVADQELVANWGFGGSGNLFDPMPSARVSLRTNVAKNFDASVLSTEEKFYALGQALVKNEFIKAAKNTDVLAWLNNKEISPITLFGIKLLLLAKDTQAKQATDYFYQELLCLLFRLSLTEHALAGQGLLSSTLPEVLKEMIDAAHPKLLPFCDDVFAIISNDKASGQAIVDEINKQITSYVAMDAFIFRDEKIANLALANNNGRNFISSIEEFISINAQKNILQFVSPEEFELQRKSNVAQNISGSQSVTNKTFSGSRQQARELADLPETIKEYLGNQQAKYPIVMTGVNKHGEHWVVRLDNHFEKLDTLKYTAALLFKTLGQYSSMRPARLKNANTQAQAIEEKQIKKIHDFLQTPSGRASTARLNQAISLINLQKEDQTAQGGTTAAVRKEIIAIDATVKDNEDALKKAELLAGKIKDVAKKAALIEAQKNIKADIAILGEYKKAFAVFVSYNTRQASQKEQLLTLEKMLDDLEKAKAEQQADGISVSPEHLEQIKSLTERIRTIKQQSETPEIRVALRQLFATAYDQEAAKLEDERNNRLEEIKSQTDLERQKIEYICFSRMNNLYQTYIESLTTKSKTLREENRKIIELKLWRSAIAKTGRHALAETDLATVEKLEKEVGYIFENNPINSSIISFVNQRKDVREFIDNIATNNDFVELKQGFYKGLGLIIQHSNHIQDNSIVYLEMIKLVFPHLLPLFQPMFEAAPAA